MSPLVAEADRLADLTEAHGELAPTCAPIICRKNAAGTLLTLANAPEPDRRALLLVASNQLLACSRLLASSPLTWARLEGRFDDFHIREPGEILPAYGS